MSRSASPNASVARPPETLAERFWSIAKGMGGEHANDPRSVVQHVLAVLDRLEAGEVGDDVTINTLNFLHLLRQQEMKGDLLYASPEQVRGEQMDDRSLVFSVGVLLFEKLTGRHPFGAEGNPNRIARIRRGELASGVNFFPKVPASLRTVLVKAMGPFPEERYRSLAEMRAKLEAYISGADIDDGWGVEHERPQRKLPAVTEGAVDAMWSKSLEKPKPVFQAKLEKPRKIGGAMWALAGAAVASIAFLLIGGSGDKPATEAPAPPPPVTHAATPAQPAAHPERSPSEARAESKDTPTAEPAQPAAHPERSPSEARAESKDTFDADVGATAALGAARKCFTEERLAQNLEFGASLVYGRADGLSRKLYWGASNALDPAEKRCVSKRLMGISAGGAPDRNTVVVHTFMLRKHGGSVRARVKTP